MKNDQGKPIVEPCINITYNAECPFCGCAEIYFGYEFKDGYKQEICQECRKEFTIKIPANKIQKALQDILKRFENSQGVIYRMAPALWNAIEQARKVMEEV